MGGHLAGVEFTGCPKMGQALCVFLYDRSSFWVAGETGFGGAEMF